MPPLEEGVVPEQEVGRAWPSLRRLALGTALAVPLAWLCFSGIQKVSSNWHAALQLDLQPSCLKDEELLAGICYMKCSLLTGGHAPHRVANAACCKADNDFFCTLISNLQAISPGLAVGGGASIHNSPHAPGVGGVCGPDRDPYQGLCYPKCSALTRGHSPHRVGSFACCHGTRLECLNGKGTVSSTASYGNSVIPVTVDHGRAYKSMNILDSQCDEGEEDFNGLCFAKCSTLTFGKSKVRTGPSSCCSCSPGFFSMLCCVVPFNSVADPSFNVGQDLQGELTDPHPPGMRVRCSSKEEMFEGICYQKCSELTDGKMPHRITSATCCKHQSASLCSSGGPNIAININLDRSRDVSNALPHAPYMRPESD